MRVILCDVGPRDGLQNEPDRLDPSVRAELVDRLAAVGLPRIEAVSFVRDDRVPQMAGAEQVVAAIERRDGVEYSGLVLNERGYERFREAALDRVNVTFAATEAFNQKVIYLNLLRITGRMKPRIIQRATTQPTTAPATMPATSPARQ